MLLVKKENECTSFLYFGVMKLTPLTILLLLTTCALAQQTTRYYDVYWKESDAKRARFVSIMEKTDSGWHTLDYYFVKNPTLEMEGWYQDSTKKIRTGKFTWLYPDKKPSMTGRLDRKSVV